MHSPTQSTPATNPRISNFVLHFILFHPCAHRFVASGSPSVKRGQERRFARKALLFLATAPEAQEEKFWKRKAATGRAGKRARKFLTKGGTFLQNESGIKQCRCMVILRDFPSNSALWVGSLMTPVLSIDSYRSPTHWQHPCGTLTPLK